MGNGRYLALAVALILTTAIHMSARGNVVGWTTIGMSSSSFTETTVESPNSTKSDASSSSQPQPPQQPSGPVDHTTDSSPSAPHSSGETPSNSGSDFADVRVSGTSPTSLSTTLPWEAVKEEGTFRVKTPPPKCEGPNHPSINISFYRTLPRYDVFQAAHDRIVDKIFEIQQAVEPGKEPAQDVVKKLLEEALALGERLQNLVINNPINPPDESSNTIVRNVITQQAYNGLRKSKNFVSYARRSHWRQRGRALPDSDDRMAAMLKFLSNGTRPIIDPTYRPRVLIDLGCRDYTTDTIRRHRTTPASSIRFFELFYPKIESMFVAMFDVDRNFAQTYEAFAARRGGKNVAFFPFAAWVHEDGIWIQKAQNMKTIDTKADAGTCIPTLDFTSMILQMVPRSVSVKMDIEYAEWQVFEQLYNRGALSRIGEMFFECHTLRDQIFPYKKSLNPTFRDFMYVVSGWGADCLLAMDVMRGLGLSVHVWP